MATATKQEQVALAPRDATVIGPSILISGKLSGDEDLTVRGRVEGEVSLSRTLIVEASGVVKADVTVRNAIVSGVVVGNVTATECVELTREGRMVGDIRAPRVIIVDGASFRGRVDMGNAEPAQKAERDRPRAAVTPIRTAARAGGQPPKPPPPPVKQELKAKGPEAKPLPPAPPPKPQIVALSGAKGMTPPAPPAVALAAKKKILLRKKR
ncbi:MAG TPA: polymer-forming cytoskeletal protein [Myxococcaceae bacterium]|nr:polymer-forming cytoskeletal protein [Myxococcaceae bacterium]